MEPPGGRTTISFGDEAPPASPAPAAAAVATVPEPDAAPAVEAAPAAEPELPEPEPETEGPSLEMLKLQAIGAVASAKDDVAVREALTELIKVRLLQTGRGGALEPEGPAAQRATRSGRGARAQRPAPEGRRWALGLCVWACALAGCHTQQSVTGRSPWLPPRLLRRASDTQKLQMAVAGEDVPAAGKPQLPPAGVRLAWGDLPCLHVCHACVPHTHLPAHPAVNCHVTAGAGPSTSVPRAAAAVPDPTATFPALEALKVGGKATPWPARHSAACARARARWPGLQTVEHTTSWRCTHGSGSGRTDVGAAAAPRGCEVVRPPPRPPGAPAPPPSPPRRVVHCLAVWHTAQSQGPGDCAAAGLLHMALSSRPMPCAI